MYINRVLIQAGFTPAGPQWLLLLGAAGVWYCIGSVSPVCVGSDGWLLSAREREGERGRPDSFKLSDGWTRASLR